jgi:hypothetical protein
VLSAHRAERILSLKLFSTVVADAEMSTRHDERILFFKEAYFTALFLIVLVITDSLFCFSSSFLLAQSIDRLNLEGHAINLKRKVSLSLSTYQHHLFVNSNSFNFIFTVHLEDSIVDEGVLLAFVCVVDAHYNGIVLSNILS